MTESLSTSSDIALASVLLLWLRATTLILQMGYNVEWPIPICVLYNMDQFIKKKVSMILDSWQAISEHNYVYFSPMKLHLMRN